MKSHGAYTGVALELFLRNNHSELKLQKTPVNMRFQTFEQEKHGNVAISL